MLKCKEKSTFDRKINYESIKDEFNMKMEKRALQREEQRIKDRQEKQDALNAEEEKELAEK